MMLMRAWWRYGSRTTAWTRRDYARHFGIVATLVFLVAFPLFGALIMGWR